MPHLPYRAARKAYRKMRARSYRYILEFRPDWCRRNDYWVDYRRLHDRLKITSDLGLPLRRRGHLEQLRALRLTATCYTNRLP